MTELKTSILLIEPLKTYLESGPIIFVNKSKKERSDETRLYFEICFSFAMVLLGNVMADYSTGKLLILIGILGFEVFFLFRYRKFEKSGTLVEIKGVSKIEYEKD